MSRTLLRGLLTALPFFNCILAEPSVLIPHSKVTYRGTVEDSIEHFQNVKFAHDTSGERRFAPPEVYTPPPNTVVDATSPGHACPQIEAALLPYFSETTDMDEDCLNLRIARPANTDPNSKLPVVVWVYGGAVVKGSAYDPHFDPNDLVKLSVSQKKPIIYVAIHYRVLMFGFARLPALKDQRSLNVGMRDQRAAFEWVKDNIEAFGGDPNRITAFGLSAGSTFISMHPLAYGGERGLPFNQAWMMSGPPGTAVNMSSDATTIHTTAVAQRLGCQDPEEMVACLRKIPMRDLLKVSLEYAQANHPPLGGFTYIPSIDDDFLPDRQSNLYRSGRFVKGIPMVFGWTQDDGAMNAGLAQTIQSEADMIPPIKTFAHALSEEQLTKLFALYSSSDAEFEEEVANYEARKAPEDPTAPIHYFRLSRILRDILFTCSSIDYGYHMAKHTRQTTDASFSGVRLYDLNQSVLNPLWKGAGMPYVGVAHGSDNNYIFNGVFPEGQLSQADKELSETFTKAFIQFAYTGDPNLPDEEGFGSWPNTFDDVSEEDPSAGHSSVNIQVVGGPFGMGSVDVSKTASEAESTDAQGEDSYSDSMQQVLADPLQFGSMDSAVSHVRKRLIRKQKLIERCAYINSLTETLGA